MSDKNQEMMEISVSNPGQLSGTPDVYTLPFNDPKRLFNFIYGAQTFPMILEGLGQNLIIKLFFRELGKPGNKK